MSFLSYEFLLFFLPITALLAALARKRSLKNAVLAAASVFFYACYSAAGLFFLMYSVLVTYASGLMGYRAVQRGGKRTVYIAGIALNFVPLVLFKYGSFAVENANRLFSRIGMALPLPEFFLPIGLSFFIFQSSTYLFELYRGRIEPERNFIDYLLFVAFFPTITSGPIQRSTALLPQIRERGRICFERVQSAALLFVWGAFVKLVLADRLAILTDTVFNSYTQHGSLILLLGAAGYSVQIYADFMSYSCMAIAVAALFGFELTENFHQPYFATSMADFWHRWHISLTSWLTDYIYIPLGGSRKGKPRRYANILAVFLISGLWHGAAWNFVVWGALHALFQIAGHATLGAREALCGKLHIDRNTQAYRCWQRAVVFLLVTTAWVFFRMESIHSAREYIMRMFTRWDPWALTDGTLLKIGLTQMDWNICILAITVLAGVSLLRERHGEIVCGAIPSILVFVILMCATVVFGCYGAKYNASAFIYAVF